MNSEEFYLERFFLPAAGYGRQVAVSESKKLVKMQQTVTRWGTGNGSCMVGTAMMPEVWWGAGLECATKSIL